MFKSSGAFLNLTHFDPPSWYEQIEALDRLDGLEHMEVWLEFRPTRAQLSFMADLFAGRSTIMHGPFIGMSLASEWDELARLSLDRCKWAVETAAYLGCQVVTFHAGPHAKFHPHEEAFERLAERLAELAVSHPRVALENMPVRGGASRETLSILDDLRRLAALLPDAWFTIDVGHCLQNDDEFVPFILEHADRIANIHLHDGIRGGRSHLALGEADLDLEGFLRCLDEARYDGYLSLETLGPADTSSSWSVLKEQLAALQTSEPTDDRAAAGA